MRTQLKDIIQNQGTGKCYSPLLSSLFLFLFILIVNEKCYFVRLSLWKTNIDLKLHSIWTKISLDIVKSFGIFPVSNLIFNTNLDGFSGKHVEWILLHPYLPSLI